MSSFRSRLLAEVKTCLMLATPLAGAQLAQAGTAFADTVMMGVLGSQTIAAGALGATLFSTLLMISTGIVSAVSPLVAQAYSAKQWVLAGQIARHGLWLSLGLSGLNVILIWQGGPILRGLGQAPNNVVMAESYLRAIVWGFLPGLAFVVLRSFVAALSRPRPILVIVILGTLINVVGNYGLSLGKWGLPRLELAGIGWASAISYWVMFLMLVGYLLVDPELRVYPVFSGFSSVKWPILRDLIQTGWPIGVLYGAEVGLFSVTTLLMGWLGTTALAAHQIALQTIALTFMVPLGISFATTIRVGHEVGLKNWSAARLAGYVGIGLASLFMAGVGLVFWLVPQSVIALYLDVQQPTNQAVVKLAATLLGVASMFQIVDGIQITAAGALRGLKDTRIPMLIGILAYWGVGLSSGYWLGIQMRWGGVGLWCGLALGLAVSACILTWRFHQLVGDHSELPG